MRSAARHGCRAWDRTVYGNGAALSRAPAREADAAPFASGCVCGGPAGARREREPPDALAPAALQLDRAVHHAREEAPAATADVLAGARVPGRRRRDEVANGSHLWDAP